MAGVFWTGTDGQIYMKGDGLNGVQKWFAPLKSPEQMGFSEIADPVNPPASAAPSGGTAAAKPALNTAAVNNTQLALDQLPGLLQAALQTEGQRYQNTVADFGAQETGQRKTYDESTTTNQQNYDQTYMDSIRAGSKGLGGLMNILRGTGAGGSSAEDEVRDIVGGVTANDIRTGADTQKENQVSLDGSLGAFLTELGRKRRVNEDTRVNNERAITRDNQTQMQDLLGKMAGFYGDAGDTATRDSFMTRAGGLTPSIASNSRAALSAYDTTPVAVQAPQITAFAEPTQPNVAVAPQDGQVGSGIFSMTDRRRKDTLVPTPVAAGV